MKFVCKNERKNVDVFFETLYTISYISAIFFLKFSVV